MQIHTAEALFSAFRASRLFTPEQLQAVVREAAPFGGNLHALLKHLANRGPLTVYQLRKIIHGKGSDLRIGPYVLSDRIGEGGMGRVYRARDTRTGREVALKVVRPSLVANPVIRGRYLREVEAAGTLRHPHLVHVEDAGESDGRYYLAMEFVDGLDLSRLVRQYRVLEVPEACEYVRQAALGLDHAHEAGFVHRDIKPSNIVVAGERHVPQAAEPAVVKVLDMGLVREVGFEDDNGDGALTRAGTVVGSPDFMAPEQAKNSSTVDHRADIYGLGCTLYYLLVGRPPFPDGTPIEKLIKHQIDAPPPIRALRPDVPSAVAAVVACMMAKRPAERYSTAAEVAEVLAPLARYSRGAQPVPVRVARQAAAAVPDTLPPAAEATPPHRPTDRTPHPRTGSTVLHAPTESLPPLGGFSDLPSGEQRRPSKRPPVRPGVAPWVWVVLAVTVAGAIGIAAYLLTRPATKPTAPSAPAVQTGEPPRPSTIRPPANNPNSNPPRNPRERP